MNDYEEAITQSLKAGGEVMRQKRDELGLSMTNIVVKTQGYVSNNFISALENGKTGDGISFVRLAILARVYRMSAEDLLAAYKIDDLFRLFNER